MTSATTPEQRRRGRSTRASQDDPFALIASFGLAMPDVTRATNWAGIAAFYLWAGAEFVAFAQLLVYVGAVSMLSLFAVLLTRRSFHDRDIALDNGSVERLLTDLGKGVRYMSGGLINCPIVIRGPANGGTNVGATKETGEPSHGGNTGGASVWWSFTAPNTEMVSVSASGFIFGSRCGFFSPPRL